MSNLVLLYLIVMGKECEARGVSRNYMMLLRSSIVTVSEVLSQSSGGRAELETILICVMEPWEWTGK